MEIPRAERQALYRQSALALSLALPAENRIAGPDVPAQKKMHKRTHLARANSMLEHNLCKCRPIQSNPIEPIISKERASTCKLPSVAVEKWASPRSKKMTVQSQLQLAQTTRPQRTCTQNGEFRTKASDKPNRRAAKSKMAKQSHLQIVRAFDSQA